MANYMDRLYKKGFSSSASLTAEDVLRAIYTKNIFGSPALRTGASIGVAPITYELARLIELVTTDEKE